MEFGVGAIVDGKVTGITKFGAFVALPEGKSGLVHISEIAHTYVSEVSEHLSEGQEVKVKVIGIDQSNRINLSIKKATEPPPRQGGFDKSRQNHHQGGQNGQGSFERPRPSAQRENGNREQGSQGGGNYQSRPPVYAARPASKEPSDFEDKLKVFMQSSDSKLAEMRHIEKKGSRRGRK